jgi:hypothetical protein
MSLPPTINELESPTEGLTKACRIVPYYGEAAASFWPIECESGDDRAPSNHQCSFKARDIRSTVTVLGEELERRPIMPNVVCLQRLPDCNVRDDPVNLCGTAPKARFSCPKCSCR